MIDDLVSNAVVYIKEIYPDTSYLRLHGDWSWVISFYKDMKVENSHDYPFNFDDKPEALETIKKLSETTGIPIHPEGHMTHGNLLDYIKARHERKINSEK